MTDSGTNSIVTVGALIAFAGLWLMLLLIHYFLVFVFAGWLGTADDFIPWSISALLLWTWTRRRFGLRPLAAPGWRRYALVSWLLAIGVAMAGVDEGDIPFIPAVPAAIAYAILPIPISLAIATSLVLQATRFRRRANAT
jgi:hypothetical protein